MASIYDFKPKFQVLLRPVCGALARGGVTANQVTLAAFALSLAHGAANAMTGGAQWLLFSMPVVLFLRMAMNAIDGMLAREFGQQSKLGAILNELTDVLSDAALYLPFALIVGLQPSTVIAVVLFGVVAEMTGVIAIQIGASRRYDGPFGKSDRALFFGALALALAFGFAPGEWSTVLMAFAAALALATIVNRARAALNEVSELENGHGNA